jgi:hypothetical protein
MADDEDEDGGMRSAGELRPTGIGDESADEDART